MKVTVSMEDFIRRELEELAVNFEGAGPDAPWRGQEIADHIRERIKNHHFYRRELVTNENRCERAT